ncbi:MAG: hypothetical protein ACPGWR_05620 [Ardenticatenaceae bacterium]
MIIISDTNILSSFASGDAFSLLCQLFSHADICIPPNPPFDKLRLRQPTSQRLRGAHTNPPTHQ